MSDTRFFGLGEVEYRRAERLGRQDGFRAYYRGRPYPGKPHRDRVSPPWWRFRARRRYQRGEWQYVYRLAFEQGWWEALDTDPSLSMTERMARQRPILFGERPS